MSFVELDEIDDVDEVNIKSDKNTSNKTVEIPVLEFIQCKKINEQAYKFNYTYSQLPKKYIGLLVNTPINKYEFREITQYYGMRKFFKRYSMRNLLEFYDDDENKIEKDYLKSIINLFVILKRLHFYEDQINTYNNKQYDKYIYDYIKNFTEHYLEILIDYFDIIDKINDIKG